MIRVLQKRDPTVDWTARLPSFPIDAAPLLTTPLPWHYHAKPRSVSSWSPEAQAEFDKAVSVGAVVVVSPDAVLAGFSAECPVFIVEQHGGKLRLIFDLRPVNEVMEPPPKFGLDTILDLPAYLAAHPDLKVAGKIDLSKAYWKIAFTSASRALFRCRGPDGSLHEWTCLPFGWSHAPHLFQSISSAFRDAWRAAGIRVCVYLDDFLILASSVDDLAAAMDIVTADLLAAGWQLDPAKCFLQPHYVIEYLGVNVHVSDRAFSLPTSKAQWLEAEADALLAETGPVRSDRLATFVGRASFARVALPRAGFFLAHLYSLIGSPPADPLADPPTDHPLTSATLHRTADKHDASPITLSDEAREELTWWRDDSPARLGRPLHWANLGTMRVWTKHGAGPPTTGPLVGRSDASDSGVGLSWTQGTDVGRAHDLLPPDLVGASSTARELHGAARLVLLLPPPVIGAPRRVVRVVLDSQCAVATATGGSACLGTATAARQLDAALEERQVDAVFEWAPRELLDAEDADSRVDATDPSHSSLSASAWAFARRWAFGTDAPGVEVECFSAGGRHSAAVFGTRWPAPGSSGDGVSLLRDTRSGPRVWAYPPFALARPATTAALLAGSHTGTRIALLIPHDPHLHRCLLDAGWRHTRGPTTLRLPDGSLRAPGRPLTLYASPHANTRTPHTPHTPHLRSPPPPPQTH